VRGSVEPSATPRSSAGAIQVLLALINGKKVPRFLTYLINYVKIPKFTPIKDRYPVSGSAKKKYGSGSRGTKIGGSKWVQNRRIHADPDSDPHPIR